VLLLSRLLSRLLFREDVSVGSQPTRASEAMVAMVVMTSRWRGIA
jgi:hypothetical protein